MGNVLWIFYECFIKPLLYYNNYTAMSYNIMPPIKKNRKRVYSDAVLTSETVLESQLKHLVS